MRHENGVHRKSNGKYYAHYNGHFMWADTEYECERKYNEYIRKENKMMGGSLSYVRLTGLQFAELFNLLNAKGFTPIMPSGGRIVQDSIFLEEPIYMRIYWKQSKFSFQDMPYAVNWRFMTEFGSVVDRLNKISSPLEEEIRQLSLRLEDLKNQDRQIKQTNVRRQLIEIGKKRVGKLLDRIDNCIDIRVGYMAKRQEQIEALRKFRKKVAEYDYIDDSTFDRMNREIGSLKGSGEG